MISKLVTITHDPASVSPAALTAALNGVGLRARLLAGGRHGEGAAAASEVARGGSGLCGSWQPPWQVLVSGALVAVSTAGMLAPQPVSGLLEFAGLAAALLGVPPVADKAMSSLRGRVLDINSLMLIACAGALALGDWTEAGALVWLFGVAEWLEAKCMGRAAGAIEAVLRLQPETALLLEPPAAKAGGCASAGGCTGGGCCAPAAAVSPAPESTLSLGGGGSPRKAPAVLCSAGGSPHKSSAGRSTGGGAGAGFSRVPASQLQPGDLVLVRPGDKVPADGTVLAGSSSMDESMLSGESRPRAKQPGDAALAGTVNAGVAALTVRVDAAPEDSTVARLGALIESAGQSKSRRDRAIEVGAGRARGRAAAAAATGPNARG